MKTVVANPAMLKGMKQSTIKMRVENMPKKKKGIGDLTYNQLVYWYECMRKKPYRNEGEAWGNIFDFHKEDSNSTYYCQHCFHYHLGKEKIPGAPKHSKEKLVGKWNNHYDMKPSIQQVKEAYYNKKEEAHKPWFKRNYLKGL